MGKAILTGLLDTKTVQLKGVSLSVNSEESAAELKKLYAGHDFNVFIGLEGNLQVAKTCDVIILSVKPQMSREILDNAEIKAALCRKLLISICAGVRIAQLHEWLPETELIRAMPNTPCKIRAGMTVLSCPSPNVMKVSQHSKDAAQKIFSVLGRCRFLDEKHMDAVTGLSGSGPAFACVVMEALADGGVMCGLARDVAIELAAQVLAGAAEMVLQTGVHPSVLKDSVTTPGGCTIAGLLCMEDGKIRSTVARAVQEATLVASGLGAQKK